jgi:zinc protease
MRSALSVVLTLALLGATPLVAQELPIYTRTLQNGLEVIVIENPSVPLVTIELDVKNGAYTQTPEYEGLAHLYEHMFFKANRTIPNQERYLERANELGSVWNGTTSTERVNYFMTLGVDSLEAGMQFMEDAIRYPLFLQDELVRERPVVIGEYDRNESNPFFHLQRGMDTLLWTPGYYSRKNSIGTRDVILSTPPEKMRAIKDLYYVPNNTALILSGAITRERGFQLAERVFGDWPRGANPFATPIPDPPPLTETKAVIVEQPVGAVAVSVQWQGPSITTSREDTYTADVLSQVLANPTSKFQKAIVDSGLAFNVGFSYFTQMHTGPIQITAQTTPDKALAVHRAILEEVEKLGQPGYVTDDELRAAQTQVEVAETYGREKPSTFAQTLGFWWAIADVDYYRGYVSNMRQVRTGDFADFARKFMVGRPRVSGLLISPDALRATGITVRDLLQERIP